MHARHLHLLSVLKAFFCRLQCTESLGGDMPAGELKKQLVINGNWGKNVCTNNYRSSHEKSKQESRIHDLRYKRRLSDQAEEEKMRKMPSKLIASERCRV